MTYLRKLDCVSVVDFYCLCVLEVLVLVVELEQVEQVVEVDSTAMLPLLKVTSILVPPTLLGTRSLV